VHAGLPEPTVNKQHRKLEVEEVAQTDGTQVRRASQKHQTKEIHGETKIKVGVGWLD
jgi:hypothetical protein